MKRNPSLPIELFPITLTVAWVLGVFAISPAPSADLWRPLALGLLAATTWSVVASAAFRGRRWLTVTAAATWLVAATTWFVGVLILLLAGARWLMAQLRRRRGNEPLREPPAAWVSRMANTLGVFLIVVALIGAVNGGVLTSASQPNAPRLTESSGPNIYLILLDGYPRADTAADQLGFSNEDFLEDLEARGFTVARSARSNYNTTLLTLASMLHMEYVHDIPGLEGDPGNPLAQVRRLTAAINQSAVVESLSDVGYRIVTMPSWYGEATLRAADDVVDSGTLTIFEEQLLRLGSGGRAILMLDPDIVAGQQRARFHHTLRALTDSGRESGPRFVFAHLFSPHPPILFRADGSPYPPPDCYPQQCSFNITDASALGMEPAEFGAAFGGQLQFMNREILSTIDQLIGVDPGAVIVLFSDHGARHDAEQTDEHFRILLAARTPDHDTLEPDTSPVELFPALLNAYFGADVTASDYRAWSADPGEPLELSPVE